MQGREGTNLLRNSYGFQMNEPPIPKTMVGRTFPMPQNHHQQHHNAELSDAIRQMASKIEGYEGIVKRKQIQETVQSSVIIQKQ